jgi:hypothetical protein
MAQRRSPGGSCPEENRRPHSHSVWAGVADRPFGPAGRQAVALPRRRLSWSHHSSWRCRLLAPGGRGAAGLPPAGALDHQRRPRWLAVEPGFRPTYWHDEKTSAGRFRLDHQVGSAHWPPAAHLRRIGLAHGLPGDCPGQPARNERRGPDYAGAWRPGSHPLLGPPHHHCAHLPLPGQAQQRAMALLKADGRQARAQSGICSWVEREELVESAMLLAMPLVETPRRHLGVVEGK